MTETTIETMTETTTTQTPVTKRLASLADPRSPRPGRCSLEGCHARGTVWYRTSLTPAGTRAVRACAEHEAVAYDLLHRLTMADCVRLTPSRRRAAIVARAKQLAEAADRQAQTHQRLSAALSGASSATHWHHLVAGSRAAEAAAQRAFAAAIVAAAGA
jgi:hypothetical protein